MVYALLRDEMAQEGGIHALQLRTMTPDEEERQRQKKETAEATGVASDKADAPIVE
jgi:BolA protein